MFSQCYDVKCTNLVNICSNNSTDFCDECNHCFCPWHMYTPSPDFLRRCGFKYCLECEKEHINCYTCLLFSYKRLYLVKYILQNNVYHIWDLLPLIFNTKPTKKKA